MYYLDCNYEHLKNVAEDEGTLLKSFPNTGKYLDECQRKCKKTKGCKSLSFCPNDKCYLYDKYITKDEPQKVHQDCYTSYKTCKSSKLIHALLQLLNILHETMVFLFDHNFSPFIFHFSKSRQSQTTGKKTYLNVGRKRLHSSKRGIWILYCRTMCKCIDLFCK